MKPLGQRQTQYDFHINVAMNRLMVKQLIQTGQLSSEHRDHIFDYDNQFFLADKYDFKCSYKHVDGYFQGIALIGNYPVCIENRNGNTMKSTNRQKTLEWAFDLLEKPGIKVKQSTQHSSMDRGWYVKTVILVYGSKKTFFTSGQNPVATNDNFSLNLYEGNLTSCVYNCLFLMVTHGTRHINIFLCVPPAGGSWLVSSDQTSG